MEGTIRNSKCKWKERRATHQLLGWSLPCWLWNSAFRLLCPAWLQVHPDRYLGMQERHLHPWECRGSSAPRKRRAAQRGEAWTAPGGGRCVGYHVPSSRHRQDHQSRGHTLKKNKNNKKNKGRRIPLISVHDKRKRKRRDREGGRTHPFPGSPKSTAVRAR